MQRGRSPVGGGGASRPGRCRLLSTRSRARRRRTARRPGGADALTGTGRTGLPAGPEHCGSGASGLLERLLVRGMELFGFPLFTSGPRVSQCPRKGAKRENPRPGRRQMPGRLRSRGFSPTGTAASVAGRSPRDSWLCGPASRRVCLFRLIQACSGPSVLPGARLASATSEPRTRASRPPGAVAFTVRLGAVCCPSRVPPETSPSRAALPPRPRPLRRQSFAVQSPEPSPNPPPSVSLRSAMATPAPSAATASAVRMGWSRAPV